MRPLKRLFFILLSTLALAYLGWVATLFLLQRSILFPGTATQVDAVAPAAEGAELIRLDTAAGRTEAIFLPSHVATGGVPQPAMVFAHGNGEVIDFWVGAFEDFRARGIGVLLVEYPGYGRSAGRPSEAALRTVLDAAYDHLRADPRVDGNRIFGFGWSLGGGAICLLAQDRPLRALILQSTFRSLDTFARRYLVPAFLLRDHFDNAATLATFAGPVLVIHGRDDRLIPWQEGQRLAQARPGIRFRLYDCGHGCWAPERTPFWRDVDPFLREAGVLAP